ncbi:hypothetical protein GRO01_13340 [Gluconobacter roseus NBRC 3990]|uniref:Uncharacterized protein n=1 Tax=Gluconobacter roseus NBRC 3990 TaxID=1307950 RepID=A0A4Y3M8B7_9PROT|nr:hypothetical protein GRO01_13340 [Gluconobacter roseus NBRC 3990]
MCAIRIHFRQCRMNPVRAARQRRVGQHAANARNIPDDIEDLRISCRYDYRSDLCCQRPADNPDDHWDAPNISEGLARQAGRSKSGRNDDDRMHGPSDAARHNGRQSQVMLKRRE